MGINRRIIGKTSHVSTAMSEALSKAGKVLVIEPKGISFRLKEINDATRIMTWIEPTLKSSVEDIRRACFNLAQKGGREYEQALLKVKFAGARYDSRGNEAAVKNWNEALSSVGL